MLQTQDASITRELSFWWITEETYVGNIKCKNGSWLIRTSAVSLLQNILPINLISANKNDSDFVLA